MHKRICGCNPISGDTAWVGHTGVMTGAITQVQATPLDQINPPGSISPQPMRCPALLCTRSAGAATLQLMSVPDNVCCRALK